MEKQEFLSHLFRTEYQKIVAVLCRLFGLPNIEIAEDIVSETFLTATEDWKLNGLPENPKAWLYAVARNKTLNYLKRHALFEQKLAPEIRYSAASSTEIEIDLSIRNIADSQLAMIFTVCNPVISPESQISLALNLLCGFSIPEIAAAFLTNKEVIYKRVIRAKEKLKESNIKIEQPTISQISDRLETVLATLYLLFSEGYYSTGNDTILRTSLCEEAMRMTFLLIENEATNHPSVNALYALMCFHSSRFDARTNSFGENILYEDQDITLWNEALIEKGQYYLNKSSKGKTISRYHLEAGIAYWHTVKSEKSGKWQNILNLYDKLMVVDSSPIVALNRAYALAKVAGKEYAIYEVEKFNLNSNLFYNSLLGFLFSELDAKKAVAYLEKARSISNSDADKLLLSRRISTLKKE